MNKHVLIVSPIPSHPQFQGNSARIYRLNQMFQQCGYKVHFVYFGMEGLSPEQRVAMEQDWDYFHYVQPEGPAAEPSYGEYFDIDDWYDQRVSILVEQLCTRWKFDVCLVNYVWFSKVLEAVPDDVYKVIDTHDVFGDRHIVAKEAGLEPVWFYTTKELESYALSRADLVIAIQDEEQAYFQSITPTPTEVIGYVTPGQSLIPAKRSTSDKVRIGYIGSGNPFNMVSVKILQEELMKHPEVLEHFDFYLAGTICRSFEPENEVFTIVGMVDDLDDFYRDVDLVINPMVGGTGLKIKSLEALSYGKPLLATVDAMVGIATSEPLHQCQTVEEIVLSLKELNSTRMQQLLLNSIETFDTYNQTNIHQFRLLFGK
jgi:glycosyltransferase involved in cell wall biosynthesis